MIYYKVSDCAKKFKTDFQQLKYFSICNPDNLVYSEDGFICATIGKWRDDMSCARYLDKKLWDNDIEDAEIIGE